jgi:hypothetical protein
MLPKLYLISSRYVSRQIEDMIIEADSLFLFSGKIKLTMVISKIHFRFPVLNPELSVMKRR